MDDRRTLHLFCPSIRSYAILPLDDDITSTDGATQQFSQWGINCGANTTVFAMGHQRMVQHNSFSMTHQLMVQQFLQ